MAYGQSSNGTTSSWTDAQNAITVNMLGDALQTVNARVLSGNVAARVTNSGVHSLLQCIQQLKSSNAETVVLH